MILVATVFVCWGGRVDSQVVRDAQALKDAEMSIDEAESTIETLVAEIKALTKGISELDKQVAEATEDGSSEFTSLLLSVVHFS
eukprot:1438249-Amphidinium_carterae.1